MQQAFIVASEQSVSMVYDLDLSASDMIFFATHSLVMIIIRATLFINPYVHDKVMGQTGFTEVYAYKCGL